VVLKLSELVHLLYVYVLNDIIHVMCYIAILLTVQCHIYRELKL